MSAVDFPTLNLDDSDCPIKVSIGETTTTLDGIEMKMMIEKLQADHGGARNVNGWVPDLQAWLESKGLVVTQTQTWAVYNYCLKIYTAFKKKFDEGLQSVFGMDSIPSNANKQMEPKEEGQTTEHPLE